MRRTALTVFAIVMVACTSALACTRKAPGPAECERIALEIIGVSDARLLRVARVKAAVDQITVECLTTPYDHELLRCVEATGEVDACFADFHRRDTTSTPPHRLRRPR